MNKELRPKVGIGVMILKDGKVLLGKRKGTHGEGEYSFPGGHLEHRESFEDCAMRETLEECGVHIADIRFLLLANMMVWAPKHYVHITMTAKWESGMPTNMEPEKCESWDWYDLDHLPQPLFASVPQAIEGYRTGKIYFGTITS